MRILLLTQCFDPEPTFKGLLFARELATRGYELAMLTGFPNARQKVQGVFRRARHIVVQSPRLNDRFVRRGEPLEKIDVIYDWCDGATIRPATPDCELAHRLGLSDCCKVMFAGTLGTAQVLILIRMR